MKIVTTAVISVLLAVATYFWIERNRDGMDAPSFVLSFVLQKFVLPGKYPLDEAHAHKWRSITHWISRKSFGYQFDGVVEDLHLKAEDGTVLPARFYIPAAIDRSKPNPTLVWMHGGGFVIGDIDIDDRLAARLAAESNMVTMSISYRLAPEHTFPAPVRDAWGILRWLQTNAYRFGADANDIYLAGESAGANLAAAFTSMNLDTKKMPLSKRIPIRGLLLVCAGLASNDSSPSYRRVANRGMLTTTQIEHFRDVYSNFNRSVRQDYEFAPLNTPKNILAQYPPTHIIAANYDPLLDDSILFASKLRMAGAKVSTRLYDTSSHYFFGMSWLPYGVESVEHAASVLRNMTNPTVQEPEAKKP